MIERQERHIKRDGALFLLGLMGIILAEGVIPSERVENQWEVVYGFFFDCSAGIMLSGICRATSEQALYLTLAMGIGSTLGTVIEVHMSSNRFPSSWRDPQYMATIVGIIAIGALVFYSAFVDSAPSIETVLFVLLLVC